jgi:hypothetical protein
MAGPRRSILSTLFSTDSPMPVWLARVDMLRPHANQAGTIVELLARAGRYDAVVLDGSARRDQVAAALLGATRRHPAIVIADATWKSSSHRVDMAINRTGIRVIDGPRTSFCVLSRSETETFPRTWRLRASRVCFAPWPVTLSEQELRRPPAENGRVFAGGNSLRDYGPLIAAATEIDAPIDIATSVLGADDLGRPPPNVTVGPVPQAEYDRMMLSASVIVVPLQSRLDRSSGQTTYVNAMARGKAIVVTDAPGVRDYVEEGQTGLIVAPGDRDGLARAVRRLLDDPEERRQIGRRAREHALSRLSLTHYATRLLDVVDETLSSPAPRRTSRGAPPADGLAARF